MFSVYPQNREKSTFPSFIALFFSLVLAKLSWQQEDRVLSEEILNLQEGETEGSLTGQFSLRLEAPPMEDGTAIDLMLTAELSDGRVLTAVAGSWTALDGQLDSSVG